MASSLPESNLPLFGRSFSLTESPLYSTAMQHGRILTAMGNAQHNLGWTVIGLVEGTYYWSVQTIDASFSGSEFSEELSFAISD